MEKREFKKLIKKDIYQVFLFSCPVSFPGSIALHYWFVINKKGKIRRWEVLHRKNLLKKKNWGHLYLNFLPHEKGLEFLVFYKKLHWRSTLVGHIEGSKDSLARKMADLIDKSNIKYPYTNKYGLLFGPNSNTYVKWVLETFPESGFKLSWRAMGKNYKIKKQE